MAALCSNGISDTALIANVSVDEYKRNQVRPPSHDELHCDRVSVTAKCRIDPAPDSATGGVRFLRPSLGRRHRFYMHRNCVVAQNGNTGMPENNYISHSQCEHNTLTVEVAKGGYVAPTQYN